MQTKFNLYPKEQLPENFKFPQSYIDLLYSKAIEKLTGVADLISFARDGDWAACFKLTDYSGNPRVYVHDLGNKDNKYECKDFDEWLAEEIKSAKEY
ncbi:MAG: SMI1/KNR4 family protein [Haemophilus parainfluenzae]|nr:SMI1/KNR4 family protein [Haemophilus parainfluenzae]